jgi:hypothetical protein
MGEFCLEHEREELDVADVLVAEAASAVERELRGIGTALTSHAEKATGSARRRADRVGPDGDSRWRPSG